MALKPIAWLGDSRKLVRDFSDKARQRAGYLLYQVQDGMEPEDWRAMPSVGLGVSEIRIHVEGEFRVLYVAKYAEAVYVLHAFAKKTQRTPTQDIDLARDRYRALVSQRKER